MWYDGRHEVAKSEITVPHEVVTKKARAKEMTPFPETELFRQTGICTLLLTVLASASVSQAALAPGDIAVIGHRSDDPDALAFVVLSPVAAGEVIRFTDCGWYATGGFRTTEGGVAFTADNDLSPGDVISRSSPFDSGQWSIYNQGFSGSFSLSTSGDQILVFQGDATSPSFVYAIHADSSGWDDATSSNTTALPAGLVDGTTAVFIGSPERDNGFYDGITEGTPEELLAAIGNPSNWVTDNDPQSWPPWSFTVDTNVLPAITDVWVSDSVFDPGAPAVVVVELSETPPVETPATVSVASGAFDDSPVTIVISNSTSNGWANVTVSTNGLWPATPWTATASAVSGCSGSATSSWFAVGTPTTYDPPSDYYDPARPGGDWYAEPPLKDVLHDIIDEHTVRSYEAAKTALQLLDEDPYNPDNLILIYTGDSVPKVWDGGSTWNREHMWPSSRYPGGDIYSDLFNLRPCDPSVNSSRGNKPYGTGSGFWDANQGAVHRGNAARTMFYDETRYAELSLVNGHPDDSPGDWDMGDLATLLEWHYEDPVTEDERRRNHLLYSSTDNPSYYQANRNPFVDHPELVWSIWGDSANDSQLYLGETPPPDGASSVTVNLGPVIRDGSLSSAQAVTLHKIGTAPTTFEVIAGGDAVSPSTGPRQAFISDPTSRTVRVGTATTPGFRTGTLVVDNTELTSSGPGCGSDDGDDTINVDAEVREHAEASFDELVDQNTAGIDLGVVPTQCGTREQVFAMYNLESVPGFTAGLDLDSISSNGDTAVLYSDVSAFSNLPAGNSVGFTAFFDTNVAPGTYQVSYTLAVSDEDLPGARPGANLVLDLTGEIVTPLFPFDDDADDDIDLNDFTGFHRCVTGPDGGPVSHPCCSNHDADSDGDVDLNDFAAFQVAFMGS